MIPYKLMARGIYAKISFVTKLPKNLKYLQDMPIKINQSNEQFDVIKTTNLLEEELFKKHYFFFSIKRAKTTNQEMQFNITNLRQIYFSITLKESDTLLYKLKKYLYNSLKNEREESKITKPFLVKLSNIFLESHGFYHSKIKINIYKDKKKLRSKWYVFLSIEPGTRKKIDDVIFNYASSSMTLKLKSLFYENGTDAIRNGYWDNTYPNIFKQKLKEYLYKNGYVYSKIKNYSIIDKDNSVKITFNISFRQKVKIEKITIHDETQNQNLIIPDDLLLFNRVEKTLNLLKVKSDFEKIIFYYKSKGYIFVKKKLRNKLIRYEGNKAFLSYNVTLGQKAVLSKVKIIGKIQTKPEILNKQINLKIGDVITTEKLQEIKNNFIAMGLFKTVLVNPVIKNSNDDKTSSIVLNIKLVEQDFGTAEIKPGFRSDLGYKLGVKIAYNNLWHKYHKTSIQIDSNKRVAFDGIDAKRRSLRSGFVEYNASLVYVIPYLFNKVELTNSIDLQKYIFYSFDAKITKFKEFFSIPVNKEIDFFSMYKFENIHQFYSLNKKDNDIFKISSLSVGLVFDLRNRVIFPEKGAFANISFEISDLSLGPLQSNSGDNIYFYKIISRNKLYYPIGKVILASSINVGYEKNLSTQNIKNSRGIFQNKGYIPSIKVFRLTGVDAIRGYFENEANTLQDGTDILNHRIDNEASFISAKIEIRVPLYDSLYYAPFVDFGKVINSRLTFSNLKTSTGLVLKYITPVGSLDLSYGIKIKRFSLSSLTDRFGQLNLLIGFF